MPAPQKGEISTGIKYGKGELIVLPRQGKQERKAAENYGEQAGICFWRKKKRKTPRMTNGKKKKAAPTSPLDQMNRMEASQPWPRRGRGSVEPLFAPSKRGGAFQRSSRPKRKTTTKLLIMKIGE